MRNMEEFMETLARNAVFMDLDFNGECRDICRSKFGGLPAVPKGFEWPHYEGGEIEGDPVENRPLSFVAQINCADLAGLDSEGLLPEKGMLSFFYDCVTQKWGFDPKHRGCARVYYFEDISRLSPMDFPEDMGEEERLAEAVISYKNSRDYPIYPEGELSFEENEKYEGLYDEFYDRHGDFRCKLLGYPDCIQGDMFLQCELTGGRGIYTGNGAVPITQEIENAAGDWLLLMQVDTVEDDKQNMMFGDCGRIYYCIRKQDMLKRKFDNIWLILQCG